MVKRYTGGVPSQNNLTRFHCTIRPVKSFNKKRGFGAVLRKLILLFLFLKLEIVIYCNYYHSSFTQNIWRKK